MSEGFVFKWWVIKDNFPHFIAGGIVTLQVAVVGVAAALVLGLVIALMRLSGFRFLSALIDAYVQFFRGIPLFVSVIWLYYGLAMLTGFNIAPVTAGLACLSILHSAYLAEIYRAGVESVGKGQREAALSVGLKRSQIMRYIVLPQAIRTVLPPIFNEFTVMLKSVSILSLVGVDELVRKVMFASSRTRRPFELYTFLAVIYIVIVGAASRVANLVERRLQYVK